MAPVPCAEAVDGDALPDQVTHEVIKSSIIEPLFQQHIDLLNGQPFLFGVGILIAELAAEVMERRIGVAVISHARFAGRQIEQKADAVAALLRVVAQKAPEFGALQSLFQQVPFVGDLEGE